jgi:HK97 family phage prohead protease
VNEEILVRSDATLSDVDIKLRLIDLIAVPWNQEADVPWRGEMWKEVFVRGAFDGIEDHAGRVPIRVNREHTKGDTVGRIVTLDPQHETGLLARVKVAKTPRGDDTLALAEDDMLSPSVGYFIKRASDVILNKQAKLRRVKRAFLDHLSFVESPAFKQGAEVLAVREELRPPVELEPLPSTPILDELFEDEVLAWARTRLGQ